MDRKRKVTMTRCGVCNDLVFGDCATRVLAEDLTLSRSAFLPADRAQYVSAGVVSLCKLCVAWVDGAGPMPRRTRDNLERSLPWYLHPQTRSAVRAELFRWAHELRDALAEPREVAA